MKHLTTKISLIALGILLIVMMFSVVTLKAQDGDTSNISLCGLSTDNIYADAELSTEDVMELYHESINQKFNSYTLMMLKSQDQASKSNTPDPNSKAPEDGDCTGFDDNYSTYCVAQTLLSNENYGYMGYLKALDCRKNRIFDTRTDELSYADVGETVMSAGISNPGAVEEQYPEVYQLQKSIEVSARLEAVEREIDAAKQTLDVTLATYDELKTAWSMHIRYVEIYENLVKYRDKMVEIRNQVEEFPSKFIDATTTMCT